MISPGRNVANEGYNRRLRGLFLDTIQLRNPLRAFILLVPLFFMVVSSWVLLPFCILLKTFKFRFIDIDLSQIGSVIFLDLLLRENHLKQKSPRFKMLVLASHYHDCNRYVLDLYSDQVIFLRNSFLKFLLGPFFVSSIFKDDSSHRYEAVFNKSSDSNFIWREYIDTYGSPLIEMPKQDVIAANALLSTRVDTEKPFIALHVRDNGFYKIQIKPPETLTYLTIGKL